jgi:hypothetical protein
MSQPAKSKYAKNKYNYAFLNNSTIQTWLNAKKKTTHDTYKYNIARFFNQTNTSPEALQAMDKRLLKQLILKYQADRQNLGDDRNSFLNSITAVQSYLISLEQDKEIKFRRGELLPVAVDNSSHCFSTADLYRLWQVGDTYEKAFIACACSLGFEISAMQNLKRSEVQGWLLSAEQNNQETVFRLGTREKEHTPRLMVLNPLAIVCLKQFYALPNKDNDVPYLFPYSKAGVQKLLNRLATDSGLACNGRLRFHNIRKWFMSRLSYAGFNEFQIKLLTGKSINRADRVYLQSLQCEIEEKYPQVYNDFLNIAPLAVGTVKSQFEQQQTRLTELEAQLQAKAVEQTDITKAFETFKAQVQATVKELLVNQESMVYERRLANQRLMQLEEENQRLKAQQS